MSEQTSDNSAARRVEDDLLVEELSDTCPIIGVAIAFLDPRQIALRSTNLFDSKEDYELWAEQMRSYLEGKEPLPTGVHFYLISAEIDVDSQDHPEAVFDSLRKELGF